MSSLKESNIGELRARFEKHKANPDDGSNAKSSPPLVARYGGNCDTSPAKQNSKAEVSPKNLKKSITKKIDAALIQNRGPADSRGKPSPPLKQKKGNSFDSKKNAKTISAASESGASSALANILQGSPKSGLKVNGEKKPSIFPPAKKPAPRDKQRTKSMEISKLSDNRELSNSFESSFSDEECSLVIHGSPLALTGKKRSNSFESSISSRDGGVVRELKDNSVACQLPKKRVSEGGGVTVLTAKDDTTSKSEEDLCALRRGPTKGKSSSPHNLSPVRVTPSKKPPPPPKKVGHLSPEHGIMKAHSTSDLSSNSQGDESKQVLLGVGKPSTIGARTPPVGRAKLPMGGVKLPVGVAKSLGGGSKPVIGTKPQLPGNKPTISKTKPALPGAKPVISAAKPKIPNSNTKPVLPVGEGKHISGTDKKKPLPVPPDKRSFSPPPPSPTKVGPTSPLQSPVKGLKDAEENNQTAEKSKSPEEAGLPEKRVGTDVKTRTTSSVSIGSQRDLDATLKAEDLEKTLTGSGSQEWIVVEKTSQSSQKDKAPKRLPSLPSKKSTQRSPSPLESTSNPPSPLPSDSTTQKNKPLPSLPRNNKVSHSIPPLSISESNSETAKPSSKVGALKNIFSSPVSSPLSPSPPMSVISNKDTPKSPGLVVDKGARSGRSSATTPPPPVPSSPLIRITPGSFSNPVTSGGNLPAQGPSPSQEGAAQSSNRGNVDSGFISEAPEDLVRGTSVESLPGSGPSEERGGVVSPSPLTPDAIEIEEGEETLEKESEPEVWDEERLEKARKKRLNIAMEILDTEKTYSGRIKVVAEDFYEVVQHYNKKSKQTIPEAAINQIFLNIRQIHQLSENILQELQARIDAWNTHEALGDVICRLAPFLKLYSTYTSGFEDAIKTLTEIAKKDRKFDSVVREFERSSISSGLGLASYMLEPVQRIPRYRLLLLQYLKYLPPDSSDRPQTDSALKIISEAADRSNDRITELENSNVILSIQRSMVDYEGTLLIPSRSFIKKGSLLKSSRKTLSPRFFFLFSDILLHTIPDRDQFKFRNEMPIFGMKVEDPKVSLTSFSFNIYSTTRSLILVASSEEEKQEWISALQSAIRCDMKKRSSLRRDAHMLVNKASSLFGTKAPIMVPDKSVTMCQTCSAEFTFTFRRHHCRACGKVVCGVCSQQKAYLPYVAKMERVCGPCFVESKNPDGPSGDEEATDSPGLASEGKPRDSTITSCSGVLNLKGYNDDAMIAGYVQCQEGRKWTKMWYQMKDCVLYIFRAHEDIKAVKSMPLLGYAVGTDASQFVITLTHHSGMKNLCETFKVNDQTAFTNWLEAIRKAVTVEELEQSSGSQSVTSPLGEHSGRMFRDSSEDPPSLRPLSQHSTDTFSSRPNSFSTVSSGSRPSSVREVSPCYMEEEVANDTSENIT